MREETAQQEPWTLARGVRQAVVIAVLMFSFLGLYLIVLKWRGPAGQDHITYVESWDELFPFWPSWVWVYLLPYLIGPVMMGVFSRDTFAWYVRRGLVLVFITLAIFII